MTDLSQLRFTPTHEWVKLDGNVATVGITDHAQKEISDVVFVELPKVGKIVKPKDSVMVVESVKAAFDIYAPLAGKVTAANDRLTAKPELLNRSPYEEGWLYKLECDSPGEWKSLLTESQYQAVQNTAH